MKPINNLTCLTTCLGLLVMASMSQISIAANIWDAGGGATTNIDTNTNWDDNSVPALNGTQTVTFGTAGSNATINVDANFAGIVINRNAAFSIVDGAGSLTVGTGGITVTLPSTTARTHVISESSLILGGDQTWSVTNNTGAAILSVSSVVSDGASTFGITKAGSGQVQLSNANTYDGATLINVGSIRISNNTALGSTTGNTTVASGAALQMSGSITVTGEALTISGGGESSNGALRSVSGNNEWTGDITIGAATTRIASDAGLLTISGNITNGGFQTLFQGNGNTTVSGVISGSGSTATSSSLGATSVLTLSNANTFTGQMQINKGIVSANTIKDFGVASSLGMAASSAIVIGQTGSSGTLLYTGGATTSNRTIQIGTNASPTPGAGDTGSATIQNDGSGALVFNATNFNTATNAATGVGADRTLTLRGANTGNNTISGVIRDNIVSGTATGTARVGVIKNDAGKWILGGNNTYTGATTVTAGTLLINGSTSASSAVSVDGGTLGGNGTIGGSVTVAVGATLAPGNSPGILSTGNLSISGILSMEINGVTVGSLYDEVNVTGTVDLVSGNTLTLALGYTPADGTNFFLINNDGSDAIVGLLNGYAQGATFTLASRQWKISYTGDSSGNTFTGGNDLVIQAIPEPATWALLAFSLTTVMVLRRRRRE